MANKVYRKSVGGRMRAAKKKRVKGWSSDMPGYMSGAPEIKGAVATSADCVQLPNLDMCVGDVWRRRDGYEVKILNVTNGSSRHSVQVRRHGCVPYWVYACGREYRSSEGPYDVIELVRKHNPLHKRIAKLFSHSI